MKRGAPQGNSNARKGTQWRDALVWALNNVQLEGIKKGEALREIAKNTVQAAIDGDATARTEVANRLDGKPTEFRESIIHQIVEVVAVQATTDWIGEVIPDITSGSSEESRPH